MSLDGTVVAAEPCRHDSHIVHNVTAVQRLQLRPTFRLFCAREWHSWLPKWYSQRSAQTKLLEMWANAQRDRRPAEYCWRPLFNAAKFG